MVWKVDCKTVGFFSKSVRKSRSLFSASFQTFCLTAHAYLNTQKYGLFCSLFKRIRSLFFRWSFHGRRRCRIVRPLLGSFSDDDGDGNENVKKAIGLSSKTSSLLVHQPFFTFLCRYYTTTTWKCLFLRFMEDVNKRPLNRDEDLHVGRAAENCILEARKTI